MANSCFLMSRPLMSIRPSGPRTTGRRHGSSTVHHLAPLCTTQSTSRWNESSEQPMGREDQAFLKRLAKRMRARWRGSNPMSALVDGGVVAIASAITTAVTGQLAIAVVVGLGCGLGSRIRRVIRRRLRQPGSPALRESASQLGAIMAAHRGRTSCALVDPI
jgi:hypothetical protein